MASCGRRRRRPHAAARDDALAPPSSSFGAVVRCCCVAAAPGQAACDLRPLASGVGPISVVRARCVVACRRISSHVAAVTSSPRPRRAGLSFIRASLPATLLHHAAPAAPPPAPLHGLRCDCTATAPRLTRCARRSPPFLLPFSLSAPFLLLRGPFAVGRPRRRPVIRGDSRARLAPRPAVTTHRSARPRRSAPPAPARRQPRVCPRPPSAIKAVRSPMCLPSSSAPSHQVSFLQPSRRLLISTQKAARAVTFFSPH